MILPNNITREITLFRNIHSIVYKVIIDRQKQAKMATILKKPEARLLMSESTTTDPYLTFYNLSS